MVIVDDDADDRDYFARTLRAAGHDVLELSSGEEALALAEREMPTLVLLDVCLPGISGYQLCCELKDRFGAGLPVVFASRSRTESYDRAAGLLVGGDEYLIKPVAPDELLIRVRRLIQRAAPLAANVTEKLTPRELDVLRLLAEGHETKEIAAALVISPKTVNTHVDHILAKLGVKSRAQAVALAYRGDLLSAA